MSAQTRLPLSRFRKVAWFGKEKTLPEQGVFLVEVLIAVSIAVTVAVFVSATIALFVTVREGLTQEARKYYLAEEGYEIVRFLRDEDWDTITSLTAGQHYGLAVSTTTLAITTAPEVTAGAYTRTIVVGPLRRATNGEIVSSGGTVDNQGRTVEVFVVDGRGTTTLKAILVNLWPS